jgi:hypothetical protein
MFFNVKRQLLKVRGEEEKKEAEKGGPSKIFGFGTHLMFPLTIIFHLRFQPQIKWRRSCKKLPFMLSHTVRDSERYPRVLHETVFRFLSGSHGLVRFNNGL